MNLSEEIIQSLPRVCPIESLPGRDQKVNEMTIKPHIRGVFCFCDDVKKVLRIEPFVEIWDKEKKEWVEKG